MSAATKNITIEKGASFSYRLLMQNADGNTPFDLTSSTGRAQIRESPDSRKKIADIDVDFPTPATGEIDISIDKAVTADLPAGTFHWDFFRVYTGGADRLLAGTATIVPTVSRA